MELNPVRRPTPADRVAPPRPLHPFADSAPPQARQRRQPASDAAVSPGTRPVRAAGGSAAYTSRGLPRIPAPAKGGLLDVRV